MEESESTLYTFKQPVEGGYYYCVVRADSEEEAAATISDLAGSFEDLTGHPQLLGRYAEGELVLNYEMREQLDEKDYAHRFVSTPSNTLVRKVEYE